MEQETTQAAAKPSISFGFKKKVEYKVDETKVVRDGGNTGDDRKFVTEMDKTRLDDEGVKKEIVIPLIQKNRWANTVKNAGSRQNGTAKEESDKSSEQNLGDEAAREIIKESKEFLDDAKDLDDENNKFSNLAVPLLLKNKAPDGFETDDKLDVSLRPDEATSADYNEIPIEAFGMAMIRGMGWNAQEGIGQTFKQNTSVVEVKCRPKGLGLGAEAPNKQKKNGVSNGKANADAAHEELSIGKGSFVLVQSGSHLNKYGVVEAQDGDTGQCFVKFALGGKVASVYEFALKPVGKSEYVKYAKDLSRFSKKYEPNFSKTAPKTKEMETSTHKRKHKHIDEAPTRKHSRKSPSAEKRTSDDKDIRQKHKKSHRSPPRHTKSKTETKSHKHSSFDSGITKKPQKATQTWLRPHLKVRIVDKNYCKGKYYRSKVTVEDVWDTRGRCSCRTDTGRLLDDITEKMLETVLPKSSSDAYVLITSGGVSKHDGKLAKILKKDKDKYEVFLQLIEDRDAVVRIHFDNVCEYTGDVEAHAMF